MDRTIWTVAVLLVSALRASAQCIWPHCTWGSIQARDPQCFDLPPRACGAVPSGRRLLGSGCVFRDCHRDVAVLASSENSHG
jgi:hypothetical protein